MASAQIASKSAKSQEHLEAGRRRLEEFRKKKGAKKAVATSQPLTSNSTPAEKQESEHGPASVDSAGLADRITGAVTAASDLPWNSEGKHNFAQDSGSETVSQPQISLQSGKSQKQADAGDGKHEVATSLGRRGSLQDDDSSDNIIASKIPSDTNVNTQNFSAWVYSGGHILDLQERDESELVHPNGDIQQASNLDFGHNQHGLPFKDYMSSNVNDRRPSDAVGSLLEYGSQRASEPLSGGFNFNTSARDSGVLSSVGETYSKRSRPSFLDSLNISRDSRAYTQSLTEKDEFAHSKLPSNNLGASPWVQDSATSARVEPLPTPVLSSTNSDYFGNGFIGQNMLENNLESKLELSSQRKNEEFSVLEQYIEDLTQEKFSLQRSMEASKALAETLAAENYSLTESYNQQASIVSQLKAEMERLQEEIKARLVELEAVKADSTNAHLECNAADDRAKLLASEVINLEEKVLRLRSNELKLERELENSNAKITSYKKKLSNLEKERRDLQQTSDALQEETKLLQSKLRKASTSGISVDLNRGLLNKDASTSTNDLSNNFELASSNSQMHDDTENMLSLLENGSSSVGDDAMFIPPDQVQVIQNINSLISEITSEKEEVLQALIDEVSTSAKLKDMNKELSHKLEIQTQRLELLTAQSMASENPAVRQPAASLIVRETVAYTDEGDEVVERVLGWIMKLFPGGPSKRRTSRL